jgi:hypothetical protein
MRLSKLPLVTLALCCAAFVGSGCSSNKAKDGVFETPRSFDGFPADESMGILQAEARFYVNHAELLDDYDLIERERVVPVALRVGLRGAGMNETQARLLTESGDMRMYLADGTALVSRSYAKIEPRREKQRDALYGLAHKGGSLTNFDTATYGLVFFALQKGDEYDADSRSIERVDGGVKRVLDLTKSVCAFKVTLGEETRTLYIGLKADRRARGR